MAQLSEACAACCKSHETIPVYPLELMGMTWSTLADKMDALK